MTATETNPVRDAAHAMTLTAFLAFMAARREATIEQARDEYRAAPQFGEAAYPALRWATIPRARHEWCDERAWRWYREQVGLATA